MNAAAEDLSVTFETIWGLYRNTCVSVIRVAKFAAHVWSVSTRASEVCAVKRLNLGYN